MLLHSFVGGVMVGLVALRRGLTGLAAAVKIGPYLSSSSATLKRPSLAQTNMLCSFDQLRLLRVFDRYSGDRLVQGVSSQLDCACRERGPCTSLSALSGDTEFFHRCDSRSHLTSVGCSHPWILPSKERPDKSNGIKRNITKRYRVQVQ
jgi:hypothetical protein